MAVKARILVLLLLAAALCGGPVRAEYESNFGRVILANSDLIVDAVASATRTRVHSGFRVELTVQDVLYGESARREFSLFYTDENLFKQGEAARGLFALRRLSAGGHSLVGKPVFTPEGERKSDDKRKVCEEFIALEAQESGDARTQAFFEMLISHIRQGGYAAENAAIELMFVAHNRSGVLNEERFHGVVEARKDAARLISPQTREDLRLAEQGMVEARIKGLKLRVIRRGATELQRRKAADELGELAREYPRAFTNGDANLLRAMASNTDDRQLRARLNETERVIRAEILLREAAREDRRPRD